MKKRNRILLTALILLLIGIAALKVWKEREGMRFVKNMGNGMNLGNTLDSANLWDYTPDAEELSYEEFWGNPQITEKQLQAIKEAGFGTVRIPVTWEDHIDEQGNISSVWMERVAEVVDMAFAQDLYVILDTHHETWLDLDISHEKEICARYGRVWTQIASRFSDYDERLLFEGMNEPRLRDSEHEWDEGTSELRTMVNNLNQTFIDSVRSTGNKNETRYLLICPYASNTEPEALADLVVSDDRIIVSVHMYIPYLFCQAEEGTSGWSAENPDDFLPVDETFASLKKHFTSKNIPVIITEFGCKDKNNLQERLAWTSYYCRQAQKHGISCIWWDNGSSYRLLDRESCEWVYPELVQTIILCDAADLK